MAISTSDATRPSTERAKSDKAPAEPLMQYFAFDHLRDDLQAVSKPFTGLAHRKLLEAKDCAVRAKLYQGS